MVARPPVMIVVDRMKVEDLPAVHVIERESFRTPWPAHAYRQELENNRLAHYIVARCGDEIVGFAGMWLLVDEAHVTTFATRQAWRRQGIGERLLLALLDLAVARGAHEATLEVRPSNTAARRLYGKYGFKVVGTRPRYYSDNNEDALIMTTPELEGRPMMERIAELRAAVAARPDIELAPDGSPMDRSADAESSAADGASNEPRGPVGPSAPSTPETGSPGVIRPSNVTRRPL
ncbi:MAG: ribosomal protein S18-alanine N-acetyltransferase [Candidatus Limnocylindrales bacterium]